jgi:hypothetical protein
MTQLADKIARLTGAGRGIARALPCEGAALILAVGRG